MSTVSLSMVVVGLTTLVVNICYGLTPGRLTCDQLPKIEVPGVETFLANTPFRFHYSLTSLWDCATIEFSRPPRGIKSHHGTALIMRGTFLNAFAYSVASDNKTIYAKRCSHGEKSVWYLSAAHFDDNGGFYCLYTCDNTTLKEFGCTSSKNGVSPAELEAVEVARKAPNGNKIHKAWGNCTGSNECTVF